MKRFAVRIKCEVAEMPLEVGVKPRDVFKEQYAGPAPRTQHIIVEVHAEDETDAAQVFAHALTRSYR